MRRHSRVGRQGMAARAPSHGVRTTHPGGFCLADSSESGPSVPVGVDWRSGLSNVLYDNENMKNPVNVVAAIGLALGGVFGLLGTVVSERNLQAAFWAIDGVGLVVATALLALKLSRTGNDIVASGFLVFAIAEGVMLGGTAGPLAGSVPSFAAGTALWSAALFLTSVPKQFAIWIRLAGTLGAILFAITAARIFWGEQVLPTASPLPFFAYPFLVLTFAGWIWTLLKGD
jgi:hypothetical protein